MSVQVWANPPQYTKPKHIVRTSKFQPCTWGNCFPTYRSPIKVSATLQQNVKTEEVNRPIANFHPTVWGDKFISNHSDPIVDTLKEEQVKELKEKVRRELMNIVTEPSQQLKFIDAVQCLGLAYHFEQEIEAALQHIYDTNYIESYGPDKPEGNDLYNISLCFRLLRQHAFNVSSDIFSMFRNHEGNFKESLIREVEAMLGLYEAAHLAVQGEDVLDEALTFTTTHLESFAITNPSSPLAARVIRALKLPIRKTLPWLEVRHYISLYQEDDWHNESLLDLAKLNFDLLQTLHKRELSELTKWWKDLAYSEKVPCLTRDRVVECYFWTMAMHFEPQYSLARSMLTKVTQIITLIDDIYDGYGTLEELELFTEAVERWDMKVAHQLPEYMKLTYETLLSIYDEIEQEMAKLGRIYRVHYGKEVMKMSIWSYLTEARWFNANYTPSYEEYLQVAWVTSGVTLFACTSFIGMGDEVTKESLDWLFSFPPIVRATSHITRLKNDMNGHKIEQERGHVASFVECYEKQHGVSEQQAYDESEKEIRNAWKEINQELLTHKMSVPTPLLTRLLNTASVVEFGYDGDDAFTQAAGRMKTRITSLLVDPAPI